MRRLLTLIYTLIAVSGAARAQQDAVTAQFFATNQSPLVGEPVQLTLDVVFTSGSSMVEWPDFPEVWDSFDVRAVGELEITQRDDRLEYRQDVTVVLWEPKEYQTPETVIVYADASGAIAELLALPVTFSVPSVLTDDLTLRPLKPLVFLSYIPLRLIAGFLIPLVFLAVWLLQRRNRLSPSGSNGQADIRELDRRMLAVLSQIDRQVLEPGAVYAAAADCLRDYLTHQYQVGAHEQTTGELLASMQSRLSSPLFNGLGQLLNQADLVKFARQIPNRESAHQYLETAARWIQAAAEASRSNGAAGGRT